MPQVSSEFLRLRLSHTYYVNEATRRGLAVGREKHPSSIRSIWIAISDAVFLIDWPKF